MADQLSTLSRETFRESIQNQREQTIPQSSQQSRMEISGQRNEFPLLSEAYLQRIPIISRAIINNILIDGVRELLVPSSSSLQQSYLQQILQQAQQYTQASQQRQLEGNNQFIIQLPVQSNQQSHQQPIRTFEQSHAEPSLLQVPLPLQMLHLINPGNINTQMLLQLSQLLANSNLHSRESSVAFQESHMRTMESLLQQTFQQENPYSSHFCIELPQQTNQYSQQQQQSSQPSISSEQSISQRIQQSVSETQELLLQISQQIPVFLLQQPIQQVQPLLAQVSQQLCPEENRDSLLQLPPQQSVQSIQQPIVQLIQQFSMQFLQQILSIQQASMQSSEQSPILPTQQSNQARPSIFVDISRKMAETVQQLQSSQPSISSEQLILQRIQQILQMSQQAMSESRRTDSGSASFPLAQHARMHQQQSYQQMLQQLQTIQESLHAQFIPLESMDVPVGILQVSESELKTSQQTTQMIHGSLEIPQISLFELPPQQFMRIIQQCPYNGPSCQESAAQSARESPVQSFQRSFLHSHQNSFPQLRRQSSVQSYQRSSSTPVCQQSPFRQELSEQLAQESLLYSDQGSAEQLHQESFTSLNHESSTQSFRRHSLSLTNQIQELSSQTAIPVAIYNTSESQRTSTEENHNNEGIEANEENERSISVAENNSLSATLETTATEYEDMERHETTISETSRPENSESQQAIVDNASDLTVTTNENTAGIMEYIDSRHIPGLNDNSSVPFHSDYLASLILTSLATLTSNLSNQQTQSDVPQNDIITSLLLSRVLNLTETNYHMDRNRNGDIAMQSRNELYRILVEDEATMQELRRRLANLSARIESLSYLINNVMTSNS